jgi:predicted N-acetyltransferase YhbS
VLIRRELPGDESAIRRVHADAFAPHYQGEPVEPQLVDDLRASGAISTLCP